MNPQQMLTQIADGFEQAVRDGWPRAHVCFFDNEIAVRKPRHTPKRHPIFGVYTHTRLSEGLTPKQWHTLIRLIFRYLKDPKQCPRTLTHSRQQIATFLLSQSSRTPAPPHEDGTD